MTACTVDNFLFFSPFLHNISMNIKPAEDWVKGRFHVDDSANAYWTEIVRQAQADAIRGVAEEIGNSAGINSLGYEAMLTQIADSIEKGVPYNP